MKKNRRLLVVDDERNIHYSFQKIFSPDYMVLSANTAEEGLEKIKGQKPDVVVMDVKLPKMDGLEALRQIHKFDSKMPIIIMTAFGTVNTAITAMKFGAYEYILKPFDVDKIKKLVHKAVQSSKLMQRSVYVPSEASAGKDESGDMIVGSSEAMQEVYKLIGQVAGQDVTVLIRGESGTGKELVARALYHHSKRSKRPFLEVNCAALPENLLESELFGHEKGSFTGATEKHIGKFEQVDGGTLFLDEIGEMSLLTQAKILRVIQHGELTRVGGKEAIKTDVRLLVATNSNLEEAIKAGKFRDDLYYRLNVITIYLPELNERREDIPELVNYFIKKYSKEFGKVIKGIEKNALKNLIDYQWHGNVRQLENCIRRAVVLTKGLNINMENLELENSLKEGSLNSEEDDQVLLGQILENILSQKSNFKVWPMVEKLLIEKALIKTNWNQVHAAKLLGIHRNTLRNRIEKFKLTPPKSRSI